jgi:hypothetical protein
MEIIVKIQLLDIIMSIVRFRGIWKLLVMEHHHGDGFQICLLHPAFYHPVIDKL